jgi:hypothetical protein
LAKPHRLRLLAALGPLVVAAGAMGATAPNAFASTPTVVPEGDPSFATQGSVSPQFLAGARTVPHWTFQYTDPTNNVTYTITMAGSDPRQGGLSEIHTVIIPLKMNFTAGGQDLSSLVNQGFPGFVPHIYNHTFDGTTKVAQTLASPEFSDFSYAGFGTPGLGGDSGQNGDVYMRAQFNKIGSGYHVKLVNDGVLPTVTLDVPTTKGIAYERPVPEFRQSIGLQSSLDLTGLAEVTWFSTQLQSLMGSLQIDSTTVPIFLTDNVLLYIKGRTAGYLNCCILGYHGAGMPVGHGAGSANGQGAQPVQTFMYSAYVTPGTYSGFLSDYLVNPRSAPAPTRGLSDIHALSHEVGEFLDDPFVNNAVLPWKSKTSPQYPCTGVLEVGDPVVGVWYGLGGNHDTNAYGQWHPEDLVFAQWFGHGGVEPVVGASWDGRMTFMGPLNTGISSLYAATFGGYSPGC